VIMEPEAKLSALKDFLVEEERQESLKKEQELEDISLLKLRSIKRRQTGEAGASGLRRKAVKLRSEELIKTAQPDNGKTLPLIIQPTVREIKLASWAGSNREFIETNLLKYGALLFRNFHVREAAEFEEVITTISGESLEYKERSSPRSRVSGNVYTSTDYPAAHKIFPHNENSYQKIWPMKVYFFCETRSEQGGQTPIVDCRRVYERIAPAIRERLSEKNWMYVRNFSTGMGLPWQTVFQTTSREAVEEHCRRNGIEAEWREGDQLRIRTVRPVIRIHPRTQEPIWFNHILPFHVTTLEPTVRDGLLAEFKEEDLPSNSYYGDGTAIEPEVLEHLRAAYREEMSIFDWEEGDVLLLDNMLAAHGREAYEGARRVMVGMAEPSNQSVEQVIQEKAA
jgi:alpha-ketoglutarate-dependent taurine dioxygenase